MAPPTVESTQGLQDHCDCLLEPDLAGPAKLLPQKVLRTQQSQTKHGVDVAAIFYSGENGKETNEHVGNLSLLYQALSPVCWVALSRAFNT